MSLVNSTEKKINILTRRKTMKESSKDQLEGAIHKLKGTAKEIAGNLTDNPALQVEGSDEKIAGKVQEKIGQIEKVFEK